MSLISNSEKLSLASLIPSLKILVIEAIFFVPDPAHKEII